MADSYYSNDTLCRMQIYKIPIELRKTLRIIAKNKGIKLSPFIVDEFKKIIDSYPDDMKLKLK